MDQAAITIMRVRKAPPAAVNVQRSAPLDKGVAFAPKPQAGNATTPRAQHEPHLTACSVCSS